MVKQYQIIYEGGEAEFVEKKSRFLATVRPVKTEDEALNFIETMKKKYWNATHNCWAYVIGERGQLQRCSDDGEPSGTAGRPMLDVLLGEEVRDVVVVVTRYFGGTLLGTGGLVHAYGASAKKGLLESGVIIRTMCDIISVKVSYALAGKIQYKLASDGHMLEDTVYADDVTFYICSPKDETERLIDKLTDFSSGRAEIAIIDRKYVDKRDESFYN